MSRWLYVVLMVLAAWFVVARYADFKAGLAELAVDLGVRER